MEIISRAQEEIMKTVVRKVVGWLEKVPIIITNDIVRNNQHNLWIIDN